jgi:hypothetical protein
MPADKIAGRLDPAQIAQMRRWAQRVSAAGSDEHLARAAQAIMHLADEATRLRDDGEAGSWAWNDSAGGSPRPLRPEQLAKARGWASRIVTNGSSPELKAAARAILLLCDDVATFDGNGTPAADPRRRKVEPQSGTGGRRAGVDRHSIDELLAGWRRSHPLALLALVVPLAVFSLAFLIARAAAPELDPKGPKDGTLVGAAELAGLEFSIAGDSSTLEDGQWKLDGKDVTAQLADGRIVYRPEKLADGSHSVEVGFSGMAPWSTGKATWSFTVDTIAPTIQVTKSSLSAPVRSSYRLEGVAEAATGLTVDGRPAELKDGRFVLTLDAAPDAPLELEARDAAGNVALSTVAVSLVPREPTQPIRAVHMSADAWANDGLRAGVLDLIEQKKINAVELDLKDESGVIGWDASVPLGRKIGAVRDIYDLGAAVQQLHEKGVRVIGRLVAFRDPILAEAAWTGGQRKQVVQTPDGGPYAGYGGFTNFANAAVRKYNIDVATAAAALGVDDILYDYVRRPDGPLDSMVFPGLEGSMDDSIVTFLAETRKALAPHGTFLGASVFGIAATRPEEIAQNVPRMAREVDYIAPMLYPSHWGTGEYGLSDPESNPHDIVAGSLADFKKAVEGTGARVVPWLQDFSLRVPYGPEQVRAQIKASEEKGIDEFLLWDPEVTYTGKALQANAPLPTTGTAEQAAGSDELVTLPSRTVDSAGTAVDTAPVDTGLAPNELGVVPVLMYHQLLADGGGEYDLSPAEFRKELERLYDEGYRPITAAEYASGNIDVPAGATPVVLTFDDSTASQAALLPSGEIDPDTAVGILLDFAETHPGFRPVATLYLNNEPFKAGEDTGRLLSWLVEHGFELGNHTRDHANLSELGRKGVQRQFVLEDRIIHGYLPDAKVTTMALPFGVLPDDPALALAGSWNGSSYQFDAVMLVGANPAPSPYSRDFDRGAIPRIRSWPTPELENGSTDWLDRLTADPELRYVSDGDPKTISYPDGAGDKVGEAYASRARPNS